MSKLPKVLVIRKEIYYLAYRFFSRARLLYLFRYTKMPYACYYKLIPRIFFSENVSLCCDTRRIPRRQLVCNHTNTSCVHTQCKNGQRFHAVFNMHIASRVTFINRSTKMLLCFFEPNGTKWNQK